MMSITKIRYIWLGLLVILVIVILYKTIVPQGEITYTSNFSKYNYFVSEFSPRERIEKDSKGLLRSLIAEPVYFYLRPPRSFDTAAVTVSFKNPAPLMELGICREKNSWNFERQPLYFKKLEELVHNQGVLQENGLLLWQREKKYSSITDFVKNPPQRESIALYNYSLPNSITIPDYKLYDVPKEYEVGLRGTFSFLTYSNGEPIDITFSMLNENAEHTQPVIFSLYNDQGNTVYTERINIDQKKLNQPSIIEKRITTNKLSSGMYRVEVKTSEDIIFSTIKTTQSRLAFINRVSLVRASRKNFSLYSDVTNLQAQTLDPQSLQTITVNNDQLRLSETYKQFSIILQDQTRVVKEIKLEHDNVVLAGDGVFSFSPREVINPFPRQFTNKTDIEKSDIDFVLAKYQPVGFSEPFSRTVHFNINPTCLDGKGIPFMIAAPEINPEKPIEIPLVEVTFSGRTLVDFLLQKFR